MIRLVHFARPSQLDSLMRDAHPRAPLAILRGQHHSWPPHLRWLKKMWDVAQYRQRLNNSQRWHSWQGSAIGKLDILL